MHEDLVDHVIYGVEHWRDLDVTQQRNVTVQVRTLAKNSPAVIRILINALTKVELDTLKSAQPFLSSFFSSLLKRAKSSAGPDKAAEEIVATCDISLLYQHLGPGNPARFMLLALLACIGSSESLAAFVDLILQDPPPSEKDIFTAFEPLFAKKDFNPTHLFPKLFGALGEPKVASIVIDLANYAFRNGLTETHPIADRVEKMRELLGNLMSRLELLAENPTRHSTDAESIAETVADSTALIISLCDSLALADDRAAPEVLRKAVAMPHRRIQVEAYAALAKLGDEKGKQGLVEMTGDPAVRLRALKYAEELGCLDEVDPKHLSDDSLAESRLATWLAQPAQMGIAPTRLELIDQRSQFWPGYDQPVECFLFRFFYSLGMNEYINIGISGPATHAFLGDLADLSVTQMYAAFAGWQAEHEEIEEMNPSDLNPHHLTELSRLQRRMSDQGYESIEPSIFGRFFGQNILVAMAVKDHQPGIAIVDQQSETWFPRRTKRNPLSPREAYCIYKGQQLLQAFNPVSPDDS